MQLEGPGSPSLDAFDTKDSSDSTGTGPAPAAIAMEVLLSLPCTLTTLPYGNVQFLLHQLFCLVF